MFILIRSRLTFLLSSGSMTWSWAWFHHIIVYGWLTLWFYLCSSSHPSVCFFLGGLFAFSCDTCFLIGSCWYWHRGCFTFVVFCLPISSFVWLRCLVVVCLTMSEYSYNSKAPWESISWRSLIDYPNMNYENNNSFYFRIRVLKTRLCRFQKQRKPEYDHSPKAYESILDSRLLDNRTGRHSPWQGDSLFIEKLTYSCQKHVYWRTPWKWVLYTFIYFPIKLLGISRIQMWIINRVSLDRQSQTTCHDLFICWLHFNLH